jgi:ArsR family transcriptional regulator
MQTPNAQTAANLGSNSDALAALLKAAADTLRLNILRVLSRDAFGVLELCSVFDVKQSAISHHLKVLAQSGLLSTRRDGNSIYYRRATALEPIAEAILQAVDSLDLDAQLQSGIDKVQAERAENSRRFFNDNAEKFKAQQDLIAGLKHYGSAVTEMLDFLYPKKGELVIEIGPGEGDYLAVLSSRFKQVVAIDYSTDMLKIASTAIKEQQLNNVQLLQGDTQLAVGKGLQANCLVVNMVLHHTTTPSQIFKDFYQSLSVGGNLVICDLCSHDQSWARESCGDIWLGFDENELGLWAEQAGFKQGQQSYLTLRNGFRIQIRHFIKT